MAQLDTLQANNIRYAILGAFGCGAFLNPADKIAKIYKEEIMKRIEHFDLHSHLIAFAIFSTADGAESYTSFSEVFKTL